MIYKYDIPLEMTKYTTKFKNKDVTYLKKQTVMNLFMPGEK